MLRKNKHTGRKIAFGAIIAGITGYLAGILTAPKSGKETRQQVAGKASEIKDEAFEQLENLEEELGDLLAKTKSKTLTLSTRAQKEFNEAVVRAKDAQKKATFVLKAFTAGKADDPQLNKAIKQAKQAQKNLSKFLKS